ncbi:DUF192 domain-containing protein [Bacillus sp. HMF5848]|uniref:DUF192 domain-containing protein n=1 Tax=Bacillus sp. HMF5848 TaxID=2495421 RepID=UPI00163A108C|nr:DUF192 domain-containing protein [Bacillus sp. HMF5848]
MQIINLSNERILAEEVETAYSFFKRLKGLMFTDQLSSGCAIHIKPCRSIHSFFMNYPIDVLYVNDDGIIVALEEGFEPGQVGRRFADAHSVVELPVETIQNTNTQVGHKIELRRGL